MEHTACRHAAQAIRKLGHQQVATPLARLQFPQRRMPPPSASSVSCVPLSTRCTAVHQVNAIGLAHGGQAVGDDDGGAPLLTTSSERWMAASVSLSTALVASSNTRMGGFLRMARARARRWR